MKCDFLYGFSYSNERHTISTLSPRAYVCWWGHNDTQSQKFSYNCFRLVWRAERFVRLCKSPFMRLCVVFSFSFHSVTSFGHFIYFIIFYFVYFFAFRTHVFIFEHFWLWNSFELEKKRIVERWKDGSQYKLHTPAHIECVVAMCAGDFKTKTNSTHAHHHTNSIYTLEVSTTCLLGSSKM